MSGLNLCAYFILPLCKVHLNKNFGKGNIKNVYLNRDNNEVIVEIYDKERLKSSYTRDKFYLADMDTDDGATLIIYLIPPKYVNERQLFLEGKYSQFSEEAKKDVIRYSGLPYTEMTDGVNADRKILALLKDDRLKKYMEETLDIKLDPSAELYDMPNLDKELWQG